MIKRSYINNIRIGYALAFLSELYFPITAWIFFYLRYLDFQQIAIITSIRVLSSNLFEVPTGAFADVVGRKKAIFLAFFFCSFVMVAVPFTSVFWAFLVLEIMGGFTNSLLSGSLEALVYDSLKENGEEARYDKVVANMGSLAWIGLFISSATGGFIYEYMFRMPWILQGIVFGMAAFLATWLHEPGIDSKKYNLKMVLAQNLVGFRELFKNFRAAQFSLIFITLGAGYFIAGVLLGLSQAKEYGMGARGVGLLFATGYIISALMSQVFPKMKSWIGGRRLLLMVGGLLICTFLFAKFAGIILGSLLIVMRISSSTTFNNLRSSVMNGFVDSKNRATAISSLMLLTQLPFVILSSTIGRYIDKSSPNSFALILGVAMIGVLAIQQVVFLVIKRSSLRPI